MMMGTEARLALSCLQTSRPLMRGIMTSSMTRSGFSAIARSRPATPSGAVMTSYPSYSKLSRRPATMLGSSSTIRIFVISCLLSKPGRRVACRYVVRGLCRRRAAGNCCRIYRQSNGELAALAGGTVYYHVATVRLHDVTHQRKAQAAALGVVYQWIAHAIKLLEYLLLFLRWDANSVIDYFQFHRSIFTIEIHSDIFPILRILQCVVYQVDDRASHGLAIHSHWRNGVDLLFKGEAVLLDLIAIRFQRV